jgi:thermostable 8-oxoguanine DNA glycosylase
MIPYRKASALIKRHLSTDEDPDTVELIRQMRPARARRCLTRPELEAVCGWKSARAIRHIKGNSNAAVRRATRRAFRTRSERHRLEELLNLKGVSVPMASAILMLLWPERYGVIDIRVWQLLHRVGAVTKKPKGVGFNFNNWFQFLMIIRHFSKKFGVSARNMERTLFIAHKHYQTGNLY